MALVMDLPIRGENKRGLLRSFIERENAIFDSVINNLRASLSQTRRMNSRAAYDMYLKKVNSGRECVYFHVSQKENELLFRPRGMQMTFMKFAEITEKGLIFFPHLFFQRGEGGIFKKTQAKKAYRRGQAFLFNRLMRIIGADWRLPEGEYTEEEEKMFEKNREIQQRAMERQIRFVCENQLSGFPDILATDQWPWMHFPRREILQKA
jgi:hypothetical protein